MKSNGTDFVTLGEVVRELEEPLHRVEYVIRLRGIKPLATLSNVRVFVIGDDVSVAAALRDIKAHRQSVDLARASARPTKNAPAIAVAEASSVILHHVGR